MGLHVLDRLAGDPLADPQPNLAERGVGEAHVAAHDEGALVSLDEVERAHVCFEQRGDPSRGFVEQSEEGHRPPGEGHQVEHSVEAPVATLMHARPYGLVLPHGPSKVWHALTRA